jgi:hypothetical protein
MFGGRRVLQNKNGVSLFPQSEVQLAPLLVGQVAVLALGARSMIYLSAGISAVNIIAILHIKE